MESLKFTLVAYALTIIFAMIIALFIPAIGWAIKKLRLDREDETVDIAVPSSDSVKEEECIAVAIAVAHARTQRK
jgi:Na+-transporting methylmalonyl-CoA/oxaloacetate decarboxylase gamma subunit